MKGASMSKEYTVMVVEEAIPLAGRIDSHYAPYTLLLMLVILVALLTLIYFYLCIRKRARIKELGEKVTSKDWNLFKLKEKETLLENEKVADKI